MSRELNNREFAEQMKKRTKAYALRIIKAVESLPDKPVCWDLGRQLLRSGSSVAANYRAACRARSTAEFVSKLGNVEEEADETLFWMELLTEAGYVRPTKLTALQAEGNEILSIVVSSIKSTRPSATTSSETRRITKSNSTPRP